MAFRVKLEKVHFVFIRIHRIELHIFWTGRSFHSTQDYIFSQNVWKNIWTHQCFLVSTVTQFGSAVHGPHPRSWLAAIRSTICLEGRNDTDLFNMISYLTTEILSKSLYRWAIRRLRIAIVLENLYYTTVAYNCFWGPYSFAYCLFTCDKNIFNSCVSLKQTKRINRNQWTGDLKINQLNLY